MPDDSETADSEADDDDPAEWWDEMYEKVDRPPWDIAGPQPAFVELAEAGESRGRVLDAGCGTPSRPRAFERRSRMAGRSARFETWCSRRAKRRFRGYSLW